MSTVVAGVVLIKCADESCSEHTWIVSASKKSLEFFAERNKLIRTPGS